MMIERKLFRHKVRSGKVMSARGKFTSGARQLQLCDPVSFSELFVLQQKALVHLGPFVVAALKKTSISAKQCKDSSRVMLTQPESRGLRE